MPKVLPFSFTIPEMINLLGYQKSAENIKKTAKVAWFFLKFLIYIIDEQTKLCTAQIVHMIMFSAPSISCVKVEVQGQ